MKLLCSALFSVMLLISVVRAEDPDCTGPERWPASMAFAYLKNARLITSENLDFSKTKVVRIASEKIKKNLYRQIHRITFQKKSGQIIDVISVNDASNEECSMSGVEIFVVSRHLGIKK